MTWEDKTVLFRIISIVRVPSLFLNLDTQFNHDDEVECSSLSVKLLLRNRLRTNLLELDERSQSHCDFGRRRAPAEWFPINNNIDTLNTKLGEVLFKESYKCSKYITITEAEINRGGIGYSAAIKGNERKIIFSCTLSYSSI